MPSVTSNTPFSMSFSPKSSSTLTFLFKVLSVFWMYCHFQPAQDAREQEEENRRQPENLERLAGSNEGLVESIRELALW